MKPLFKYPGGKFNEYNNIKRFFPKMIENYFEPFFGAGGVFFNLVNEHNILGNTYINDYSDSLIDFYKSVKSQDFINELEKLYNAWEYIKDFSEEFFNMYGMKFAEMLCNHNKEQFIDDAIFIHIKNKINVCDYDFHGFSLIDKIVLSINDKYKRFSKKELKFDIEDTVYNCITTSICQAFYFTIRDMYNDWNNHNNKLKYTIYERSSHWLFIREFCFGSMFRYNSSGDFNVPYGGFGYNSKCFKCKINAISNIDVRNIFNQISIDCLDFEDFISNHTYGNDDFMFLDPPYDSTFTDYDKNSFTKDDHKRLMECIKKCKCKWLMAIGKTDYIMDLYKDFNIIEYDKTYMYQARGNYDNKHTKHIIVTNY